MNRMDEFFKKQLTDFNTSDDNWNIPSEELWNAAKPHFPKKDKKRKFLIWFLSIGLLVIGTSFGFFLGLNSKSESLDDNVTVGLEKIENTVSNTSSDQLESSHTIFKTSSTKDNGEEQIATNENINQIENSKIPKASASRKTTSEDFNSAKPVVINSENTNDNQFSELSNNKISNNIVFNESILHTQPKGYKSDQDTENPVETKRLSLSDAALIPTLENQLVNSNNRSLPLMFSSLKLVPFRENHILFPKKEWGLSNTSFILDALENVVISSGSDQDQININDEFRNINLHYSKWIGKNWSISTGLQYSKLKLDIDFSVWENLSDDEIDDFLNQNINDLELQRSSNSSSRNFTIDLLPGVMVENQDLLNFQGRLNLDLKAAQLPVFLNYHFYRKRFEFILSGGIALEYIQSSQIGADFQIFRDNVLISEESSHEDFNENYFDYSIYLNHSIRYKITQNIHFGISAKLSVIDPIFSGADVGLYYRWNHI